jgi:hypothetical protein
MEKKIIVFGSLAVLLVGGIFLWMWRSHVMGPDARTSAGGLVAVSSDGTPIPAPPARVAAGKDPENQAVQVSGGLLVSLALNPYPPSVTKTEEFVVMLMDANGQAVSDAAIRVDLSMPGMMMPPNQFSLAPEGAGKYQASSRFSMRGPWRIEVILTISGKDQLVFFDVWL